MTGRFGRQRHETWSARAELLHHAGCDVFLGRHVRADLCAGLLVRSAWAAVQPFGDTLMLAALAAACVINFGRNRTLHCGMTGPLFILGAVAAALIEAGIWQFDMAICLGCGPARIGDRVLHRMADGRPPRSIGRLYAIDFRRLTLKCTSGLILVCDG